jgi:Peptidase family M1 domain
MKRLSRSFLLILFSLLCTGAARGQEPDPAALWKEIQSSRLDTGHAVSLKKVKLGTGLANLQLDDGVLFPATGARGKTAEVVFLGHGRVTLDPPDSVEAGQLELFTGGSRLDEEFKEAVFVIGLDAAVNALLKKPAAQPDPEAVRRAEALYKEWKGKRERKLLDVDRGLLLDALDDPAAGRYFVAWFRGTDLGDFLYQVDPSEREQVTLGHFAPLDATEKEKRKLLKELAREQKKGRLIGLQLDDLGQWDSWVSSPLHGADGKAAPGGPAFEPKKYTLDVTLAGRDLHLTGRARLDLDTVGPGTRALTLKLPPDYQVQKVTDAAGEGLFYQWNEGSLTVVLPRAPAAGQAVSAVVEYAGNPVAKDWNLLTLRDTTAWYPRTGSVDRAVYDVTLHWPKGFDVAASGRRVDGGETADGTRWERRSMDNPAPDFSFEVGHYKFETAKAGHVEVHFAFGSGSAFTGRGVKEDVIKSVTDSLAYYEEEFGPYPLDHLTVTTASRTFSQGILGFVTLSDALLNDAGMWNRFLGLTDRRLVIAHEMAHQWWGDQVGWTSYRDQWISEAMASYAALLYSHDRLSDKLSGVGLTAGWQSDLGTVLPNGRTVESVGPVVLGPRLNSSLASDAYRLIVYKKGEVVLDMLARALGEDTFPKVLKQIVKVARGGTISTEDFIAMVERITSTDLQGFADQFIYGTGLPEVLYSYHFEKKLDGKGWLVQGEARQQMSRRYRYRVVTTPRGTFDVTRELAGQRDVRRSMLVVPVEIAVYDPQKPKGKGQEGANGAVRGHILLKGETTPFALEVDQEPKGFWLDPSSRVFGLFFDEKHHLKRSLYSQGLAAAAAGRVEDAAALYEKALAADDPPPWDPLYGLRRFMNGRIQLSRCRLLLDQGRDEEAVKAFDQARHVLGADDGDVTLAQARLDVRHGDYEKAFRRLRKGVSAEGDLESGEGYALLAVAARATGHPEELEKALKKARESGVDVAALAQPRS